jgi:hypothetical protein
MKRHDKKEAMKTIQIRLEQGRPRKEILEELAGIYDSRSSLAELIARTPDPKKKEKYKLLNYILVFFLLLSVAASVYAGIKSFAEEPVEAVIVSVITLLILTFLIIEVLRFNGYIYGLLTFLLLLGLITDLIRRSEWEKGDLIGILLLFAFTGLAFYLNRKIFPNYGIFGLKKDNNGDYLLE